MRTKCPTIEYLAYLGIRGEWLRPLLWPAVVLHAVLTLLLAKAWFKSQESKRIRFIERVADFDFAEGKCHQGRRHLRPLNRA